MSGKIKFLIIAALVLISAAALTFVNSGVEIDYCKGVVKLNNGFAVLKETDSFASVIKLDDSGKVKERANILLNDPFTLSVKSVHDLFTDNKDNLYVFCSVYGPNRSIYETIYKCDFLLGGMKRIWSSKQVDGYSVLQDGVPYIDESGIYLSMLNSNGKTVDILKFSDGEYTAVVTDCVPNSGLDADKIFYRDGVVVFAESAVGIVVNGEKIYPRDGVARLHTALNYDNGILSFIDITENKLMYYDISAKTFSEQPCHISAVNVLQASHAYSDGTVTAVREDGEYLRAYRYLGDTEETYSRVSGDFSLKDFAVFTAVAAVVAILLTLAYMLLFVRIRKQKDGAGRYQSIATRITAISTAVGIICGITFAIVIYDTVKRLNNGLQNSIDTNGSQFLASYIYTECNIEMKNGVPMLSGQSSEKLYKTMESYQNALNENNNIDCDFILLAESNGKLYWLRSQFDDSVSAEYVLSLQAVELIRNSIETGNNCVFEDKMTTGRSKYTCTNFPIFCSDNTSCSGVLCTVTDAYRVRQTGVVLYLWLIAVIFGLVILLLAAANIVLRCNLSRLKKLRKAFALYENGGKPSVFKLPGGDEIAETGQALMLMTEGTQVHARDINEGNRKYKRFMAAGILKMMNRSEISKVNFGDSVSENALILRFIIDNSSDITERVKMINGFIEISGGILLNFGGGKADICFTDEKEYGSSVDLAVRLGYPSAVLVSFGKVEAGSAGSDCGAWLIAVSEEFAELDNIRKLGKFGGEPRMICTKKAAEELNGDEFLYRCELRPETLGNVEFFYIISEEPGGENESETFDNNTVGDASVDGSLDPVL